jgi:hypothetical protein
MRLLIEAFEHDGKVIKVDSRLNSGEFNFVNPTLEIDYPTHHELDLLQTKKVYCLEVEDILPLPTRTVEGNGRQALYMKGKGYNTRILDEPKPDSNIRVSGLDCTILLTEKEVEVSLV